MSAMLKKSQMDMQPIIGSDFAMDFIFSFIISDGKNILSNIFSIQTYFVTPPSGIALFV